MNNLKKAIERCLELDKEATSGEWPSNFARCDTGGTFAMGPLIQDDENEIEEIQAQSDQDLVRVYRTLCPKFAKALSVAVECLKAHERMFKCAASHQALSEIDKIFMETKE